MALTKRNGVYDIKRKIKSIKTKMEYENAMNTAMLENVRNIFG
jgi:hypothetical protein